MGRKAAVLWHATFSIAAGLLYFFFVLPRWPELMGDTSHALGTAARIIAGVVIALAALPVVFTLLRSRKPKSSGTPQLALTLQTGSVVAHVLAKRADRRHGDQRNLAEPGQRRPVAVRHLRCRGRDRGARHLHLLPIVRRRAAAASAETAEAQEKRSQQRRRRKKDGEPEAAPKRPRKSPSRMRPRPPTTPTPTTLTATKPRRQKRRLTNRSPPRSPRKAPTSTRHQWNPSRRLTTSPPSKTPKSTTPSRPTHPRPDCATGARPANPQ